MSALSGQLRELRDDLNMTYSERVTETAENVAHLRD